MLGLVVVVVVGLVLGVVVMVVWLVLGVVVAVVWLVLGMVVVLVWLVVMVVVVVVWLHTHLQPEWLAEAWLHDPINSGSARRYSAVDLACGCQRAAPVQLGSVNQPSIWVLAYRGQHPH